MKTNRLITEFDVTRATLEQVFNSFARFQNGRNEDEPDVVVDGVIVNKNLVGGNSVSPDDVQFVSINQ